jgi:hypothetical protein
MNSPLHADAGPAELAAADPRQGSTAQDPALLHMDFSQRVVVDTNQQNWTLIPSETVWRKPLEREAAESDHTTSIVRFGPDSYFSTVHGLD